MSAIIYYKGTSSVAHSFDVVMQGKNLSKSREDRKDVGFTEEDMRILETYVQNAIDQREGRR